MCQNYERTICRSSRGDCEEEKSSLIQPWSLHYADEALFQTIAHASHNHGYLSVRCVSRTP